MMALTRRSRTDIGSYGSTQAASAIITCAIRPGCWVHWVAMSARRSRGSSSRIATCNGQLREASRHGGQLFLEPWEKGQLVRHVGSALALVALVRDDSFHGIGRLPEAEHRDFAAHGE